MKILHQANIDALSDLDSLIDDLKSYFSFGKSYGLIGNLGAGKTTFTRLLMKKLGSDEQVSSPSYVLQHEYKAPGGMIEHWDLYRLSALPIELAEPVAAGTIRIIEWADKFEECMSDLDYVLKIELISEQTRSFTFAQT